MVDFLTGGEGGIRTRGTREGTLAFQASPFDRSGTSPYEIQVTNITLFLVNLGIIKALY